MKTHHCRECQRDRPLSKFSHRHGKIRNICNRCAHLVNNRNARGIKSKDTDAIHHDRMLELSPVKVFTRKQIEEVEHLYTNRLA